MTPPPRVHLELTPEELAPTAGWGCPRPASVEDANLVGSLIDDEFDTYVHSPVLDIDFAARLVPSSTPDHFHLYLDGLRLGQVQYAKLLIALAEARVISYSYLAHSLRLGMTVVRKEGVVKTEIEKTVES